MDTAAELRPHHRRCEPWTNADVGVVLGLAFLAACICAVAILRRPDINASATFLFSDPGVNLLLAERLTSGDLLFRDVAFSYGPLAIYPFALFAKVFGDTPQSYGAFLAIVSVVNVALAYVVLRRQVSRASAVIVSIGGIVPTMLIPGSLVFGIHSSTYFVLERALFLLLLLAWEPPGRRTTRSAVRMGLLLGLGQGVRFGTALFLGLAVVVIDVLALLLVRADLKAIHQWVRTSLMTLAAFLAMEGVWIVLAFATLPRADAIDFLWPSYVLEAFRILPDRQRWPTYGGLRLFFGQQFLIVVSATLALFAVWLLIRDQFRPRVPRGTRAAPGSGDMDSLRLLLPFAFYSLGTVALFQWDYHFNQYAWTLPLAAALMLDRRWPGVAVGFGIASLPGLALVLRANFVSPMASESMRMPLPRGGHVTVHPTEKLRIDRLREYASDSGGRQLLIVRNGAGFFASFGLRAPTRQLFYILGFAREGDEDSTLRALESRRSAVVLTDFPVDSVPSSDPCEWYGYRQFRSEFCPRLAKLLDPTRVIRVDSVTWIVPIAGSTSRDSGEASPGRIPSR